MSPRRKVLLFSLAVLFLIGCLHCEITFYDRNQKPTKLERRSCDCGGHNFCFSSSSRPFSCSHIDVLRRLGLMADEDHTWPDSLDEAIEPVFVSAASSNHMTELAQSLIHFQKAFPKATLLLYNLGLSERDKDRAAKHYDPASYGNPRLFGDLMQYRWKILIIAEVLRNTQSVWYMDSSIRWSENASFALSKLYASMAEGNLAPIILPVTPQHSIFFGTHPGMYEYLPIPAADAKKHLMYAGGWLLATRTADVQDAFKWLVLCALEPDCMAPPGATLSCDESLTDRWSTHAGESCHRFDQSAINIVLSCFFNSSRPYHRKTTGSGIGRVSRRYFSIRGFFSWAFGLDEEPKSCAE